MREKLLIENEDPRWNCDKTDSVVAICTFDVTDNPEPNRTSDLIETEDPQFAKSMTEHAEPIRA